MSVAVDWSKLKSYKNDKRKSFEELSFQIATRLYDEKGTFTSIDDSGGGDGVEFYLTQPDGTEWGWQAKFFHPGPRLDASRKRSIKNSLSTSRAQHKKLTRWFLCTPTSFTKRGESNELNWFKELEMSANGVKLIHWGDSQLMKFLAEPRMAGIQHYFFGTLELTPAWFQHQTQQQIRNVGDKYIPALHTRTSIDSRLNSLGADSQFVSSLDQAMEFMRHESTKIEAAVTAWGRETRDGYSKELVDRLLPLAMPGVRSLKSIVNEYQHITSALKSTRFGRPKALADGVPDRRDVLHAAFDSLYKAVQAEDDPLQKLKNAESPNADSKYERGRETMRGLLTCPPETSPLEM